jgi:hypothetical protein
MQYYVYKLVDPRNKKPFYIGKGKNGRMFHHQKEALKGSKHRKCVLIREILNSNLQVVTEIVKYFDKEQDAYDYEEQLIAKIGLANLTNISKGGRLPYPCVDEYVSFIESVSNMLHKTKGNYKDVVLKLGGVEIDLSAKFESVVKKAFEMIFINREHEWVINQFKLNGIELQIRGR